MDTQSDFFDTTESIVELSVREKFEVFHGVNPSVYAQLRKRAIRAKRRGFKPGMRCLFELLRWGHGMRIDQGDDEFRLNNNYTPFYARLLMDREPELAGFFEIRDHEV